jgi:hypothetical protein
MAEGQSWACRCGTACVLEGDRRSCDDCGWIGCTRQCLKPNLQKPSGSGSAHYSCVWCRTDVEMDAEGGKNDTIEVESIDVEMNEFSTIADVEKLFRCLRCTEMKKDRGSLFCEEADCMATSCGCDKDLWFVCPFQLMLNNFRLRGVCPGCLQRLKDEDIHLTAHERVERDAREWQQGCGSGHHLQYLRFYVSERDSYRNELVQEYLKSLENPDFV